MKICTINVPDRYLDVIKVLVDLGFYPSRSEAVRVALKQFLNEEKDNVELLDNAKNEIPEYLSRIQKIRNEQSI